MVLRFNCAGIAQWNWVLEVGGLRNNGNTDFI